MEPHGLDELPDFERRERLRAGLARLIQLRGYPTFVDAPLLEPTNTFFPDRWARSKRGVKRLIRRILWYAGLDGLHVDLEVFDAQPPGEFHVGIAAWFAGIADGRVSFGLDLHQLDDRERLVGVLCHEVAHAYRAHHGLVVSDRNIEEALTDLTTIYLGFGMLTVNASYAYRTQHIGASMIQGHQWQEQRAGYLTPAEMSFLLAIQTVVRELDEDRVRRIAGLLSATQSSLFREARRTLADDLGLPDELGVPAREEWPEPSEAEPVPFPDDDEEDSSSDEDAPIHRKIEPQNEGQPVFRVRTTNRGLGAMGGTVVSVVPALLLFDTTPTRLLAVGIAAGIGIVVAEARGRDLCSDTSCATVLPEDASTCPECGGTIAGRLDDPKDRLAAQEALENDQEERDSREDDRSRAVKDFATWQRWVSGQKTVIAEHAVDEEAAKKILAAMTSASRRPSSRKVGAALEHYGIAVDKNVLDEAKLRNVVAHTYSMGKDLHLDVEANVRRVRMLQTLIAALVTRIVGYRGPVLARSSGSCGGRSNRRWARANADRSHEKARGRLDNTSHVTKHHA